MTLRCVGAEVALPAQSGPREKGLPTPRSHPKVVPLLPVQPLLTLCPMGWMS